MVKCPFCGYANEDGVLFCEQCKSDIGNVAPAPSTHPASPPTPMPESFPAAEAPMMAAIVEEPIVVAIIEETVVAIVEEPVAAIIEEPVAVAIVEEPPVAPMVEEPPAPTPAESPFVAAVAPAAGIVPPVAAAPPVAKAASGTPILAGSQPKLVVQRGLRVGEEYNIFGGENFVGRADEKPVDIDLTFQEPEDRVWASRQHALLVYDEDTGNLTIEDLNSSNGTFVNRERVYPGQPRQLFVGNTIQIGTVHMKIKA
jgi:hypothetical protein